MKILFFGDIVGRSGRQAIKQSIDNLIKNVIPKYGKPKKITGLRIDGIWSVFEKYSEDGDIKVWNVASFCGFGDVEY